MTDVPEGWAFCDAGAMEWQQMGEGVAMKSLGAANGKMMAMFRFDAGYVGAAHDHADAEFTYLLEGDLSSNGVAMQANHAYVAEAGTSHSEFSTTNGATLLSVFATPG